MCNPISQGGQRCAAHTRPRFQQATPNTAEWDDTAAAYAATREGRDIIATLRADAHNSGDITTEVACTAALRRADTLNQIAAETADQFNAATASPTVNKLASTYEPQTGPHTSPKPRSLPTATTRPCTSPSTTTASPTIHSMTTNTC